MLTVQLLSAALTLLFGVAAVCAPVKILSLVGLRTETGRGITEARVALGAIYLGAGAACLWLQQPAAFATLGFAYCVMAVVRAVSMLIDRSADASNGVSLALEIGLGLVLVF